MIAAAFPPTGGPGVQRSAKFAKYLPGFGWQPIVWALDHIEGMPRDPSLLEDLPTQVISYAPHLQGRSYSTLTRAARQCAGRGSLASRFISALNWRFVTDAHFGQLLDDFSAWASASLAPLSRLVVSHRIDVLYSTFSPASNHWLGLMLKERTGLPWVADFRDLWIDDCRYAESSGARRRAHREFQQLVLENADIVVGVTPSQTRILAQHVPHMRSKFVTITNGFDPADFESVPKERASDRPVFVLAHVGRLDKWRATEALFDGLRSFAARLGSARTDFEFRIVGHAAADTLARVGQTGVPFTFVPYVSHREAVLEMTQANALLLPLPVGPRGESIIAAKLFEYLAAGKPILIIGPTDGECENIVQGLEAGLAVRPEAGAIADSLWHLFSAWSAGTPLPGCRNPAVSRYSRISLTSQLADCFQRLAVAGGSMFSPGRPSVRGRTPGAGRQVRTGVNRPEPARQLTD